MLIDMMPNICIFKKSLILIAFCYISCNSDQSSIGIGYKIANEVIDNNHIDTLSLKRLAGNPSLIDTTFVIGVDSFGSTSIYWIYPVDHSHSFFTFKYVDLFSRIVGDRVDTSFVVANYD